MVNLSDANLPKASRYESEGYGFEISVLAKDFFLVKSPFKCTYFSDKLK